MENKENPSIITSGILLYQSDYHCISVVLLGSNHSKRTFTYVSSEYDINEIWKVSVYHLKHTVILWMEKNGRDYVYNWVARSLEHNRALTLPQVALEFNGDIFSSFRMRIRQCLLL